jgi:hypothetical protein
MSDTTLLDCSLARENPSKVAACCIYAVLSIMSGKVEGSITWSNTLAKHSTYTDLELK